MTFPVEPVSNDGTGTGNGDSPGLNPAWNDVLGLIPPELHSQVTPHFQKWDQHAQSRIETLNGNLKGWEPYQPLLDNGIEMQTVAEALKLHYDINTNPQGFYKALANHLGIGDPPEGGNAQGNGESGELSADYKKLQEHLDLLSQAYVNDRKAREAADADAALNRELEQAIKAHEGLQLDQAGMNFVLSQMQVGNQSAKAAVDAFVAFKNSITPPVPAPTILGGATGGVPSQAIDVTKLTPQQVRAMVAQIAERNAAND